MDSSLRLVKNFTSLFLAFLQLFFEVAFNHSKSMSIQVVALLAVACSLFCKSPNIPLFFSWMARHVG